MTVQEFVESVDKSRKYAFPPESLFTFEHPEGEKVLCLGSFAFGKEAEKMLEGYPDLLSRRVVRESITQEEYDALKA